MNPLSLVWLGHCDICARCQREVGIECYLTLGGISNSAQDRLSNALNAQIRIFERGIEAISEINKIGDA